MTTPSRYIGFLFLSNIFQLGSSLNITQTLVGQFKTAAELSQLAYDRDLVDETDRLKGRFGLDSLSAYRTKDNSDQSLVAKKENTCYGVFRGVSSSPTDLVQLIPGVAKVEDCKVFAGLKRAYDNSYRDEFDSDLTACMDDCPTCELVLSGHSQGASVAVVASLFWYDQNPIVITFGGLEAVAKDCGSLNPENHYRLVNTVRGGDGRIKYDIASMLPQPFFEHYGQTILLSENDEANLQPAYVGLNDNMLRTGSAATAHAITSYGDHVDYMYANGVFPIQAVGWPDGTLCGYDEECESSLCEKVDGGKLPQYCGGVST